MYRASVAAALLLGIASVLVGDNGPAEKPISKLIEELGNRDFKVRQRAARAIEALGPQALPALRKAKDHPEAEVRRRIAEWIPKFELEAFVAPKQVTMNLRSQPLHKAIEELARQTGYQLEFERSDERARKPCSFKFDKADFWEALDRICQEGGLALYRESESANALSVGFQNSVSPYLAHHGAFRMAADGLEYRKQTSVSRSIQLASLPRGVVSEKREKDKTETSEIFRFEFALIAEPRLTILGVGVPDVSHAVDDQDRSLVLRTQTDREELTRESFRMGRLGHNFAGDMRSVEVFLQPPAKDARILKLLRGTVPVTLEKEKQTTVLTEDMKKAQGKEFTLGNNTVKIQSFAKHPIHERYDLFLTMTERKPGAGNRLADEAGEFELQDGNGNPYEIHGKGTSSDGLKVQCEYSFGPRFNNAGALGQPSRLVYSKSVPLVYYVPFEFKDLPLP